MGFWDNILKRPQSVDIFSPNVTHLGADESFPFALVGDMSPSEMWATQPHLRIVVSFLARNIAQLGLHSFERDGDDRVRDRTSPLARALVRPNASQTAYDLIFALVGDLALYDRAYWLITNEPDGGYGLLRLPPVWVTPNWADAFRVKTYTVRMPGANTTVEVPAEDILPFSGYHPTSLRIGSPTIESLKSTLQEQIEAARYRAQVWKRGGRVSAVIERPKDAPDWSDAARTSFREDWYAKYTGRGPKAGGTPILEDGMQLKRIDFNAQEQQFVEAAKLSFATVASAFHVNPTMVGILDNANYSNVREFRRMLYGDTLGPLIAQIEARVNTFLLPRLGMDSSNFYAEFNIAEKLQGSFEEQASVMQTLVGAPLMTRNEGRGKFNLPGIEGGDMLVTPLNVLMGDPSGAQTGDDERPALTADDIKQRVDAAAALIRSGFEPEGALAAVGLDPIKHLGLLPVTVQRPQEPENVDQEAVDAIKGTGVHVKARAPQSHDAKTEQVLRSFFKRQRGVILPAIGAKAGPSWWDAKRWDKELADDLYALAVQTSKTVAADVLKSIGFKPDVYDVDRTLKFLRAVAESRAGMINSTTRDQLKAALASDDEAKTPAHVFDIAESDRAVAGAAALVTTFSSFGSTEAAKQATGDAATKTWIVTSRNPRASHSSMSGETVGIDETFSNGMDWPGDPTGGADEVAGCQCDVEISIP